MKAHVRLTVSESKRLIAKGVAAMGIVKKALAEGMVSIAKGTTNGRVVEEILGEKIDRSKYVTGNIQPSRGARQTLSASLPDVVLRKGTKVEGLSSVESVSEMKQGDVFMKGCNALNYEQRLGGILIGHPTTGGTIGGTLGAIYSKKIHLVLPVGLEKNIYADINKISRKVHEDDEYVGGAPTLMPVSGHIVTEIEALKILAGVKAVQVAAGGVAGAEGSVWLLMEGEKPQIEKALKIIAECRDLEEGATF